jgi:prevent-host-death family protein
MMDWTKLSPFIDRRLKQTTAKSVNIHEAKTHLSRLLVLRPLKDYIQSDRLLRGAKVRYSTQIRPISYLKANAAEVLQELTDQRQPMVITQNGEAKAVIQDVASYEETQETLALLKILALGNQQVAQGRVKPLADVAKRIRALAVAED